MRQIRLCPDVFEPKYRSGVQATLVPVEIIVRVLGARYMSASLARIGSFLK